MYLSLRQKKSKGLYKQNRKVSEKKQKKTNAYSKSGPFVCMTVSGICKMHVYDINPFHMSKKRQPLHILYSQSNGSTNVQTAPTVHI